MKWKSTRRSTVNKNGKRTIWKYAQADFARARSLIDETDWDLVLTGDVNESLINWEYKVMEIMEMCIPKKSLPRRRKSSVDDKKIDENNQEKKWFLSACKKKWKPDTF